MQVAAEIIDKQVSLIVENHRDDLETVAGRRLDDSRARAMAFTLFSTRIFRRCSTEEALPCITDGGDDHGADAIYLEPDGATFRVTVVQCKLHKDLDGRRNFPGNAVEKVVQFARRLLTAPHRIKANPRLQRFIDEISARRDQGMIPTIRVVLCSNGLPWISGVQQFIDDDELRPFLTVKHYDHHELLRGFLTPLPIHDALQFSGFVGRVDFLGGSMLSGFATASELSRLAEVHGPALIARNIRGFLGIEDNVVNQAIAESLQSAEGRQRFVVRNLGITLVCSSLKIPHAGRESPRVTVWNLLLLNGAQTMSVLAEARHALARRRADEDEPLIAVRLIEMGHDELPEALQREIILGNNHQTPVDLKELHADAELQRLLETAISQLGFVYHRRRDEAILKGNSFGPVGLAEAILAIWRRQPQRARAQVAERYNDIYPIVFTDQLTGTQAVIAGLIWRRAEQLASAAKGKGTSLAQNGWAFAAMLMGQMLLEEVGIKLGELDHRQFARAQALVKRNSRRYFDEALEVLSKAVRAKRRAALDSLELLELFDRGSLLRYLPKPATSALTKRSAGKSATAKKRSAPKAERARRAAVKRTKAPK